jgi:TRAP-type mannitol/chloroaromatic compound transport system permease small subunit
LRILLKPFHIRALLKLSQAIDTVSDTIGKLSGWIVILTIAVGFYNVTARYLGRLIGLKLSSNAPIELQW